MSDFLQFIDRIPSLPNRKKITHSDSSVEYATIEYADEPIEEGTFLNKANFNKLNAVLGYNLASLESQTETHIKDFLDVSATEGNFEINITSYRGGTLSSNGIWKDLNNLYELDYSGKATINNGTFHAYKTYNQNNIEIYQGRYSSSTGGDGTLQLFLGGRKTSLIISPYKTYLSSYHVYLYNSNNELIASSTNTINDTYDDLNEIKITYVGNYTTNNTLQKFCDVKINKIDFDIIAYTNNLAISNNLENVVDGQIINVKTNNILQETVYYNNLNNIDVDTILEPNKYYELVYNSTLNKFIAEEVRNAN